MNFTVSEKLKGSCVLNTLGRAIWKGMSVSICGNKLYAPDIKLAIKRGILIPVEDEYSEEMANTSYDVVIVNKTDKLLVLDKMVLKPGGSKIVSKVIAGTIAIQSARKNGLINIISDELETKKSKKKTKKTKKKSKKKSKKKTKKKAKKKVVKTEEEENSAYVTPETGADREVKALAWNFRDKSIEEAQIAPKAAEMVVVDKETVEDIDFVDNPLEAQQVTPKKKTKKKASKKKAARKTIKKKGKATKKRKVKSIEPVGDKRLPKTQMDAAIELDSRGNPIDGANLLDHLIDSLAEPSDVPFVDQEQAQDRYIKRTDME